MNQHSQQQVGIYFWMLLVPLFWGGAFSTAKHVITEISPITAATLRFVLAAVILLAVILIKGEWQSELVYKHWLGLLLMALTGIFGYNVFFFIALTYTSSINGALIIATTPVFMTIGAVIFFKESWNRYLVFGLFASFFGAFLIIIEGSWQTLTSLTFNTGDLLFIAALFCWVAHGLIGRKVTAEVSPLLTTTSTTLLGALFLAILSLFVGEWGAVLHLSGQSWLEMLFMIVCASIIGFFLWNKGIKQIGASKSSIYMNLVPLNTTWIAVFFYGEQLFWAQIGGMVLVMFGVYITLNHKSTNVKLQLEEVKKPLA